MHVQYRPEIDGLRAVAVVPVIFFHAGFQSFGGGFVGVDVFFVISGYLITSIILSELSAGTFSLASFYERRARRILPALFLVMAVSMGIGWAILFPDDLLELSKSMVAATFFVSNVFFWYETGYFDTAAELKPLLHTWSLAVEEQYYIVFPLLLMVIWKAGRTRVAVVLALLAAASLIAAEWAVHNHREAAFFLLPFRLWELVAGAGIALLLKDRHVPLGGRTSDVASAIGLALILWSVFAFDKNTPFPGVYALAPVVGTALVIVFASASTVSGRLLGSAPLVGVGLISYSAYLWHQPLLAFARYQSLAEPPVWVMLGICAATFVLAYFSWRFVEVPFRRKDGGYSARSVVRAGAAAAVIMTSAGLASIVTEGYEDYFVASLNDRQRAIWDGTPDDPPQPLDCHFFFDEFTDPFESKFAACAEKYDEAVLVLGDSHAKDLFNAVSIHMSNPFVVRFAKAGCRPHRLDEDCHYDEFEEFLARNKDEVGKVIFNQAGFYLVTDVDGTPGRRSLFRRRDVGIYPPNVDYIERVAAYLDRLGKSAPVLWVGPWLEPHVNVTVLRRLALNCRMVDLTIDPDVVTTFEQLDQAIADHLTHYRSVSYVSSQAHIALSASKDLYDCNGPYWSDGDHWSAAGERRFGERLSKVLQ